MMQFQIVNYQQVRFVLVVLLLVLTYGCATPTPKSDDVDPPMPKAKTVTMIQPEDDAIIPLYKDPETDTGSQPTNSRSKSVASTTPKNIPTDEQKSDKSTIKETSGQERPVEKTEVDVVATDTPRRTSMPTRDNKEKKQQRVGGIRKAVPVDRAASVLFGKWKVDQVNSSVDTLRGESVLFMADGRMRVWRNGSVDDGRWTWNKAEGVKTGGLDGVPFLLGTFEIVNGAVTFSMDDDKHIVLTPDRIFIAPKPVLPQPKTP